MYVVKRDGRKEPVSFSKIEGRIHHLCNGLQIDQSTLAQKVISNMKSGLHEVATNKILDDSPGEKKLIGECEKAVAEALDFYSTIPGVKCYMHRQLRRLVNRCVNNVMEKLVDHSGDNDWTDEQADNAGSFAKMLPGEQLVVFWTKMSSSEGGNFKNVQKLPKRISQALLKAVNG